MSTRTIAVAVAVLAVVVLAPAAWADWNPGMPYKMHYPQMPNMTSMGLDVLDGPITSPVGGVYQKFLADDFLCTQMGPITDIHVWGSYLNDLRLGEVPLFNVAIFGDVPAGPNGPSHPGDLLWQAYMPARVERPWGPAPENFFDPNIDQIIGPDNFVWQYNFYIPPDKAFVQQAGQVYWLGVKHSNDLNGDGVVDSMDLLMLSEGWAYGWKSSQRHFNDDAVWIDVPFDSGMLSEIIQPVGPWRELVDPRTGNSLDLAFVITPEPATLCLLGAGLAGLVARRIRRK